MLASEGSPRAPRQPGPSATVLRGSSNRDSAAKCVVLASICTGWRISSFVATHLQLHLAFPLGVGNRVVRRSRAQHNATQAFDASQPAGVVQSRRAIGGADRARRRADRGGAAAGRRRRNVADRADAAAHPVRVPAGLLADRISRRRLMAGAESFRALALVAILALIGLDLLSLPLLAVAGFVAVCGTVV